MPPTYRHNSTSSAHSHNPCPSIGGSEYSDTSTMSAITMMSVPSVTGAHIAPTGGLPCEFVGYSHCDLVFALDDVENWIEHIIVDHLEDKLPRKVLCWFCDQLVFDSKRTGDRRTNFDDRMYHIREHFLYDGKTAHDMRPDHSFNRHLREHRLISEEVYNRVRKFAEAPQGSWIIPHDATPRDWHGSGSRIELEYHNPHDEERRYRRRNAHKHGKSRK